MVNTRHSYARAGCFGWQFEKYNDFISRRQWVAPFSFEEGETWKLK